DGKIISHKGQNKQVVHLEKGKLVPIKIEYQSDQLLNRDSNIFKEFKLFKVDSQQHAHQVQLDELRNPAFNKKETQQFLEKASKTNLFTQDIKRDTDDDDKDTDGDSIPDLWEENGYTIQNKIAVKWDDSFAAKGYTKFVSNPLDSHTVGDPYTDYEKAARDLDLANAKETFNPLVAAFPSVNVNLEKVILSKDENLSNSVESHSSTNWSYTNTEGASIEAGAKPEGPTFGVSATYQHSETVAKEWGTSTGNTSQFNTASAGYLNANVRYNNVGTGAIYEVKPTTSFVLDNNTFATITAKSNSTALSISPGESYPKKGQNGIAINTMDDFNSHPIKLNKQQLDQVLNNDPIMLETNQADGVYKIKDTSGNIVTGGEWNGVIQQIQAKTASIIVDTGESVSEKRIAAKNYDNPEDKTPSLSLKEALKLGYPEEIKEKDGLLYYNDKPIYESSVMTYLDENTAKEVKEQLNDTTGKFKDVKQLFDVKLTPKMNFTIKLATLYDGAEDGSSPTDKGISSPLGEWVFKPDINNVEGGNTGKRQYRLSKSQDDNIYYGMLAFTSEVSNKLKKNYQYYISMSIKADIGVEPTVSIIGASDRIVNKQFKLNSNGYQRFDILVDNSESNPIDAILLDLGVSNQAPINYSKDIYIDDITITEVSAMKEKN
ncbi:binary toxin-like calcium binding domain-containing protein, partial [Bacillus thuringiensis]